MRVLTIQELLLLNQYVQGIVSRDEINKWFFSFNENDKQSVVKNIWVLAIQAKVKENDIKNAMLAAGLKPAHTPVVMITNGKDALYNRGYRLSTLKGIVLNQVFLLVLECFVVADNRRKEKEDPLHCNHWWHKDLSDEQIIKNILK